MVLLMIFISFKPLNIKQQKFVDVPLFKLNDFTLYELSTTGLNTVMFGSVGIRYSDRYKVENIDYTDNSKQYIVNMKANYGQYKNNIIDLTGDVVYYREDGLTFDTQKVVYDKTTHIVIADSNYTIHRNNDNVVGTYLKYDNLLDKIESKNVTALYNLQER